MEIITNNIPRRLLEWYELTEKEQGEFNYLEKPEWGDYIRYRGSIYELGEFHPVPYEDWDVWFFLDKFEHILLRFYIEDYDYVIMGRAIKLIS